MLDIGLAAAGVAAWCGRVALPLLSYGPSVSELPITDNSPTCITPPHSFVLSQRTILSATEELTTEKSQSILASEITGLQHRISSPRAD